MVTAGEEEEISKAVVFNNQAASLKDLFVGDRKPTDLGRAGWFDLVPGAALQANCNREGFNATGGGNMRVRLGILGNENGGADDCSSPDSFIGLGGTRGSCDADVSTVGSKACYSPLNADDEPATNQNRVRSFGYLFVR